MTSEELDAAAGLSPRNCNRPRFDPGVKCLVHLAAFAGTLAVAAMVLAVINFGNISSQVDRLDRLTQLQSQTISSNYSQRRVATLLSCLQIELLKSDARAVLTATGVDPGKLPMRKDASGRVFSPNDCARVVEDRVPASEAPPGTDLRLPDIR